MQIKTNFFKMTTKKLINNKNLGEIDTISALNSSIENLVCI